MVKMNLVGFAGFKEEDEFVYLYQCPVCKRVVFNIDVDTECDCSKNQESKPVIVSKRNWVDFLEGRTDKLQAHKTNELHHEFGDNPEDHIIRLIVCKVKGE